MSEQRGVRGLMGERGSVGAPNDTARCRLLADADLLQRQLYVGCL